MASARRWTRDRQAGHGRAGFLHGAAQRRQRGPRPCALFSASAFDDANARLSTARVDKDRLEVRSGPLRNAIVHDCKVPLERALELPGLEDRGATEDTAFKLRRRIANIGTINPTPPRSAGS